MQQQPSATAALADVVFPDAGFWAKEGTTVSADRRILRMNEAHHPRGEAQQGWRIIADLGRRLAERLNPGELRIGYTDVSELMDEISRAVPLFKDATYADSTSRAAALRGRGARRTASRSNVAVSGTVALR
jgi:predicted molibdopterin-dependent oxidoreductase YjgC